MKETLVLRLKIGFYFALTFVWVMPFAIPTMGVVGWFASGEWYFAKSMMIISACIPIFLCPMTFCIGFFTKTRGVDNLRKDLEIFKGLTPSIVYRFIEMLK